MTVLEASKSTNARADGFAAFRAGKTAGSSALPMSWLPRTRTSGASAISFLAAPTVIKEPEPGDGGRQADLIEDDDEAAVDSYRGRLLGVNGHERPSSDGATQGSSVKSAAT